MPAALASRRAVPVATVAFGLLTLGVGMSRVPLHGLAGQARLGGSVTDWLTPAAALVPAAAVGALLAARRPRNPIGWILLTVFLLISAPVSDYLVLDYRMYHGTLPLGWLAVGLTNSWPVLAVLVTILLWVFPDGHLPSGRWRRLSTALAVSGVVLALVVSAGLDAAAAGHAISVDSGGNLSSNGSAAALPPASRRSSFPGNSPTTSSARSGWPRCRSASPSRC